VLRKSARLAPVPATTAATEYVHDGFYLRVGAGPIYARASLRTDRVSQPDVSLRGLGGAFEVWVGGTPGRGLSIGGLAGASQIDTNEAKVGSHGHAPGAIDTLLVGFFIDAYPDPRRGFHFGGLVAGSATKVTTDAEAELPATEFAAAEIALAVFAGLDVWVARQWSFGALLRLGGGLGREKSKLDGRELTTQGSTYSGQVLINVLCH
jgi:hypothetical protein